MTEPSLEKKLHQESSLELQIKAALNEWLEYNLLDHITTKNFAPLEERLLVIVRRDRAEHNKQYQTLYETLEEHSGRPLIYTFNGYFGTMEEQAKKFLQLNKDNKQFLEWFLDFRRKFKGLLKP